MPREDKGASLLLIRVSPFCKTVTMLSLFQTLFDICNSGALARSGAPWVRKCSRLLIRENLVIKSPYTDQPTERPSVPQAYQYKIIQSTAVTTEMQLKVLFGKKLHGRPDF